MSGEKTEKPTEQKKKQSRKEGQVARTQEFGGWLTMLAFAGAAPTLLAREAETLREFMVHALRVAETPTPENALDLLTTGVQGAFLTIVALGSAVMVLSVAASLAQGGFFLATKSMKPSFSKFDLVKGTKRLFGPQSWWEGAKMLMKTGLLGALAYGTITSVMPLLGGLMPTAVVIDVAGGEVFQLLRFVAVAGLLMAGVDYLVSRRRTMKQVKMTKEEVKQEHKNTEGDPLLKSAIRARQIATSRNRMIAEVAEADVVLVNPTHVAVALRYQPEKGAPVVVARGSGAVAARIRAAAAENGVTIVRDVPLARALYRSTDVGMVIPTELFAAVAQVLAFVIGRRGRSAMPTPHDSPRRSSEDLPDVQDATRRRRQAIADRAKARAARNAAGTPASAGPRRAA
ncbi:EscU/YscU/HrcU family type III secretion system export apparatus switch protein [Nocardioides sp. GY 10127]|uniref:EscU/YscU/HrcU family type III secretion system export apparatus switch protein n=1 Tax=Nocardioides sp. GY 10127 TaxID=2569762 RepID=UPI0010A77370|nr:EscU/YscU/HrcU family type III secretion system export apparatus switch protein [Nocardioides sp. GY 10127]TIC78644.1 EscU/YscU/HrcU family type III secretion system export apparatus switch protein [Nocardioides sp. GY 10127]